MDKYLIYFITHWWWISNHLLLFEKKKKNMNDGLGGKVERHKNMLSFYEYHNDISCLHI